VRAGRCD